MLMPDRHDALLAAAEIAPRRRSCGQYTGRVDTVATVGVCGRLSRAVNGVPSRARTRDRHPRYRHGASKCRARTVLPRPGLASTAECDSHPTINADAPANCDPESFRPSSPLRGAVTTATSAGEPRLPRFAVPVAYRTRGDDFRALPGKETTGQTSIRRRKTSRRGFAC